MLDFLFKAKYLRLKIKEHENNISYWKEIIANKTINEGLIDVAQKEININLDEIIKIRSELGD